MESAIEPLVNRIANEFGYRVQICAEIEYAFAHEGAVPDAFWQALLDAAEKEDIPLESIGREKTPDKAIQQYECRFRHSDALTAATSLNWLNVHLAALSKKHKIKILDAAKSNEHSVYSGLHWHLHLLNDKGDYCFFKQEENLTPPLAWTIGGLLETLPALMPYFAPSEASYLRLNSGADHIPTTLSWGNNNRTCALRLPESVVPHRHIEHRICGNDTDPFASVWAILVGIHYGLKHQPVPPPQCFGDANRELYPKLPLSPQEASEAILRAEWLKDYAPRLDLDRPIS